jgi:LuxR family transcriptional regulator, maltose regulon positive regulatory protein
LDLGGLEAERAGMALASSKTRGTIRALATPGGALVRGTKLHAPPLREGTIRRPRLTGMLVGQHPALVLIVAPPGFGKTSLLADWADRDDRRFAWVSIGPQDNDLTVLWTYVGAALAGIDGGPSDDRRYAALASQPDPVDAVLRETARKPEDIVLVLEDYHLIRDDSCHDSIMRFVQSLPSNVQVVISSRTEPPFAVARLRASSDLMEIGANDLRFTRDESEDFLNRSLDLQLDRTAVSILHERTEGWPAGLYLAYLSLRGSADPDAFVATFGASNRHVGDYLTEQVLAALEPDTLEFMLATSIVDEVCGPLADAMTGRTDSAERLVALERANVFLIPLDDKREWYRYHHLLSELLRLELRRRSEDREATLHLNASAWFEEAGDADRAIRHAIDGGDRERAARLISASYLQALEWGRIATIATWLQKIGEEQIAADARLAIVKAWVMHFLGLHAEGAAALASALRAEYQGVLPDGASSVQASAALMGAAFPGGDVREMVRSARRAFEFESHVGSPWRTTVHVLLGFALVREGSFAEADPYLELGSELATEAGLWMDAVGARSLRARVAIEAGDADQAVRFGQEAVALADAHGVTPTAAGAFARAVLGAVLVRAGRPHEAQDLLVESIEALRILREPLPLAEALLALAQACRALGRRPDAIQRFEEADALIDAMADPGYLSTMRRATARAVLGDLPTPGEPLSPRELDVLRLLAAGLSNREVAAQLFVSYNTVHSHVRSIYRKLGVASRTAAVDRARDQGLMS